jgi:hypothetical protein
VQDGRLTDAPIKGHGRCYALLQFLQQHSY